MTEGLGARIVAGGKMARILFVNLCLAVGVASSASADYPDLQSQAQAMLATVFDALATGDPEQVAPLLAEEFQVVRSDGGAYGKAEYLAKSIPKIKKAPVFTDIVATGGDDIVVVRFTIEYDTVFDGKQAEARSPQLIVFRVRPEGWQVVAAANFAALSEQ